MIKIAFAGAKGSGKNTASAFMKLWLDRNSSSRDGCKEFSFAEPIKQISRSWLGMTMEHTDGFLKEVDSRFVVGTPNSLRACLNKFADFGADNKSEFCKHLHGKIVTRTFSHFHIDVRSEETVIMSPRYFMQQFGTEVCREIRDSIWIDVLDKSVRKNSSPALITDLRFQNEYDYCKSNGYHIIHIDRPDLGVRQDHASEKPLAVASDDYYVKNDGSLAELKSQIDNIAQEIMGV